MPIILYTWKEQREMLLVSLFDKIVKQIIRIPVTISNNEVTFENTQFTPYYTPYIIHCKNCV